MIIMPVNDSPGPCYIIQRMTANFEQFSPIFCFWIYELSTVMFSLTFVAICLKLTKQSRIQEKESFRSLP